MNLQLLQTWNADVWETWKPVRFVPVRRCAKARNGFLRKKSANTCEAGSQTYSSREQHGWGHEISEANILPMRNSPPFPRYNKVVYRVSPACVTIQDKRKRKDVGGKRQDTVHSKQVFTSLNSREMGGQRMTSMGQGGDDSRVNRGEYKDNQKTSCITACSGVSCWFNTCLYLY